MVRARSPMPQGMQLGSPTPAPAAPGEQPAAGHPVRGLVARQRERERTRQEELLRAVSQMGSVGPLT
jgi:hypothetical protein